MRFRAFLIAAAVLVPASFATQPAEAVVYCTYDGIPHGCVARPGVPLHAAPGVGVPGVGAPGVGAGAAGLGVHPGTPVNRGGPVDRLGPR